jgi:hypothetical protein
LPVSILLSSPVGGEAWQAGAKQLITWSITGGSGPLSVSIEVSAEGSKGPWTTIASNLEKKGSFEWSVPNLRSTNYYLKVSVIDAANPAQIVSKISESSFAIVGPQETSTTAAVVAIAVILPLASVIAFVLGRVMAKRRQPRLFHD